MVDADHGYGNALNVKRTVEELEVAGIAGLSIEDTLLPRSFGSGGRPELLSIEEGVGKMKAAIAGRSDPGLCIFGRTSAAGITGTEDCIARVRAYAAAGVDAIFLVGVKDRPQLDAIAAEVSLPLMLGGGGPALMDRDYLASKGVRICLQGHQPFAASVQAVYATLKAMREGVDPKQLQGLPSEALMRQVTRGADYDGWVETFLE